MEPPRSQRAETAIDELTALKRKYESIALAVDARPKWTELYDYLRSRNARLPPQILYSVLLTPYELRERYNPQQKPPKPGKTMEYQVLLRMELLDYFLREQKERTESQKKEQGGTPQKGVDLRTSPRKEERRMKKDTEESIAQLQKDTLNLLEYLSILMDPEHLGIATFMEALVVFYMRPHPTLIKFFFEALDLEKPPELGSSPKRKPAKDTRPTKPNNVSPPKPPLPASPAPRASPKGSLLLHSGTGSGNNNGVVSFHTTKVKRKRMSSLATVDSAGGL